MSRRRTEDGPDKAATVLLTARLAELSSLAGDHIRAREQHGRLQSLQQRLLDDKDLGSLDIYMFIAEAEMRAGRYREADRILHEAMALADKAEQPAATANALQVLGTLNNRRSRFKEALPACRRSLEFFHTVGDPWNPNFIVVHECIGEALLGLGDAEAARKALEPAITAELDAEKGPQWTAGAKLQLARALWATGEKARAVALAHAAHRSLVGAEGDNSRLIGLLEAWLKTHHAPKREAAAAAN
jgi:tetratricopeptide (TPR) repeat protein